MHLEVDPTMSGLNLMLAKGENRISSISLVEIILKSRVNLYAWSSDVTKLYNKLHLEQAALLYSLFLYSDDLDPSRDPTMVNVSLAWYQQGTRLVTPWNYWFSLATVPRGTGLLEGTAVGVCRLPPDPSTSMFNPGGLW